MKYANGHEFEYRPIRPSLLKTDPLYQRDLDVKRVDKIAKDFSGDIFNEPKVSYRDGCYWVFDGQHSVAAWRKIHNGTDSPVVCKVFKGMTWLEECEAFVNQNGIQRDPTTNDKLRAAYNSKNPDVCDMVRRAELCGFKVDFQLGKIPSRIVCTATLFRAYKAIPPDAFQDMVLSVKEAWFGDLDAVSQQIIGGMAAFYRAYYGHFKHDDLVNSLKRVSPAEIIRNGKSFTSRGNTYGKEILKAYNKKRHSNRLDDNL